VLNDVLDKRTGLLDGLVANIESLALLDLGPVVDELAQRNEGVKGS